MRVSVLDFTISVICHRCSRYNAYMDNPLDADRIATLCHATSEGVLVEVVAETMSTNTDLRQRLDQLHAPVVRVAEYQHAGRGRAGRVWHAARGASLCFSMAWPFERTLAQLAGLPLAVGVALAEVLRAQGYPVTLKWPNDLLLDGAKLGGVLVETGTVHQTVWAVVGVGINVHPNPARDQSVLHAVAALGGSVDRNELLPKLVDSLVAALHRFNTEGLAPFIDRWQRWHAFTGLPVSLTDQGELLHQGTARGIDADGCLQLETAVGIVSVAAGDISLRPLAMSERRDVAAD